MTRIISFMHLSLDGFVSGTKGELNWAKVDEELFSHVEKRISKGNTAMYGRVTYDMMEAYWPNAAKKPNPTKHDIEHSRWYAEVNKIVLSKTLSPAPGHKVKVISNNIAEQIKSIKEAASGTEEEILVFGSPSATHALLKENLIDGFWLFVNPLTLGEGVRLFPATKTKLALKLVNTQQFSSGVVELNYTVENSNE